MKQSFVNRRQFLHWGGAGLSALLVAACANSISSTQTTNASPVRVEVLPTATATTAAQPSPTAVTALFDGITYGITDEGFPYLGDPNAPLTMIDYSDFL